jgi:hypothetical protein
MYQLKNTGEVILSLSACIQAFKHHVNLTIKCKHHVNLTIICSYAAGFPNRQYLGFIWLFVSSIFLVRLLCLTFYPKVRAALNPQVWSTCVMPGRSSWFTKLSAFSSREFTVYIYKAKKYLEQIISTS